MNNQIAALSRDQLVDLLDNTLGVGCYEDYPTETLQADAQAAYNAGAVTDEDVEDCR